MRAFHAILRGHRLTDPGTDWEDPPYLGAGARQPARRRAPHGPPPPPTPLHTLTLAEVMSPPDAPLAMSRDWERKVFNGWRDIERAVVEYGLGERAVPLPVAGYGIAHDLGGRVIAVIETATGAPAGGLYEGNLHILAAHQGRGLATAVTDLAFESGLKRADHRVALSEGGRATRRSAHRRAVVRALANGVAVREEVLADYPDLAPAPRR